MITIIPTQFNLCALLCSAKRHMPIFWIAENFATPQETLNTEIRFKS